MIHFQHDTWRNFHKAFVIGNIKGCQRLLFMNGTRKLRIYQFLLLLNIVKLEFTILLRLRHSLIR